MSANPLARHRFSEAGRIAIIGAGPAGLGAAWRLCELGHDNWVIVEASDHAGGLASSVVDASGFTWDLGGHVLFSHYPYFDRVMDTALGDAWVEHVREAWVWMRDRWIPYPFQNNVWRLPQDDLIACINGLIDLQTPAASPRSFRDWLLASFGTGICDVFMLPYNRQVWAYDPSRLDVGWMGERVATVDVKRVLANLVLRRDDVSWGPNATFRFPVHGGTGSIWRAVAGRLPASRIQFERHVTAVDLKQKQISLLDGDAIGYDYLISTMALDDLLRCLVDRPQLTTAASGFVYSSSHIVGIGLKGSPPADLRTKCWIYFPEDRVPFYRATVFSNYSPNNVPTSSPHWSLMAEVSESPDKPVEVSTVVADVIAGFLACGFIDPASVVSTWHRRLEHGYPTPWLGRDAVLAPIDAELRAANVFSRGRFGAWKYEVSNQDHAFMQGVETVDHIVNGAAERTYHGEMR
jgi:protoporphyrinogen oxidase